MVIGVICVQHEFITHIRLTEHILLEFNIHYSLFKIPPPAVGGCAHQTVKKIIYIDDSQRVSFLYAAEVLAIAVVSYRNSIRKRHL